jgi:hypothetical protein
MDTLHSVLRSIRGDTKSRHHLDVFREFLTHLDRIGRRPPKPGPAVPKRARTPRGRGKR